MQQNHQHNWCGPSRRSFMYGLGATLGTVALNAMLRAETATTAPAAGPLAVKPPHHKPRAKACIFLFMEGGPSHIDLFDPKPKLNEMAGQRLPASFGSIGWMIERGSSFSSNAPRAERCRR